MKKEGSSTAGEIFSGCCFPPAMRKAESIRCVLGRSSGNIAFAFSHGIRVCSLVLEVCELRLEKKEENLKRVLTGDRRKTRSGGVRKKEKSEEGSQPFIF